MNYQELSCLLFPHIDKDVSYYEQLYPEREEKGHFVTRFAPSPTGFIHMGSLYVAFISELFSRKNNGTFFLRIEDTDQKRLQKDGIQNILADLKQFAFTIDEGPMIGGNYGPYIQSERKEIYECFAKELVSKGLAYPCFCTKEELDEIRAKQEKNHDRIGYYGKWAKDRNLSMDDIREKINQKNPYVIRLKSQGHFDKRILFNDLVKGKVSFPENDLDIVLIKSDGLPTYHFAHAIDDHLMHTTHIIRGDEWLSSLPIHFELFKVLGFKFPKYAHISPINKKENNRVRKLSKRYDLECRIDFYYEKGFPIEAIKIYLATLINPDFDNWYNSSHDSMLNFDFTFKKMSISGPLFDYEKLVNISKTYFSLLTASNIYDGLLSYSKIYDERLYNIITKYKDYTISVLNIERNQKRPRKDISCYQDFKKLFWYMYDEYFNEKDVLCLYKDLSQKPFIKEIMLAFLNAYQKKDSEDEWLTKIKQICDKYNYASNVKDYKENQGYYYGHIGDVCSFIRNIITTKNESPNLYEILKILSDESIKKRIEQFLSQTN